MRPQFIQLEGATRTERNAAIQILKDAILSGRGFITDFTMFSNKAACIKFEVSFGSLGKVRETLGDTAIVHKESLSELDQIRESLAGKPKDIEVMGTLNVTFIHDEPDLRIETPSIPG